MMITKEELEFYYIEQDMTQTEIGKIYGCDRKNVDYYLKKYKIPKRTLQETMKRYRKTDLTASDIDEMVKSGMLIQDICDKYNVSRSYIYDITSKAGLNYNNHKHQRKFQSKFMSIANPFNDEKVAQRALKNSKETMRRNFGNLISTFDESINFKTYAKRARYVAYDYFNRGDDIPKGMVIDHIYSIKDGYANKIPISIISHHTNLRLITSAENAKKAFHSHKTIDELYKAVGVQRLSVME